MQIISDILSHIPSFTSFGFNGLDAIIFVVFLFYALEGFEVGFIAAFFDLLSFIGSFAIGLRFYGMLGGALAARFSMPQGFAKATAFFIIAFISEIILNILFRKLLRFLSKRFPLPSLWYLGRPNTGSAVLLSANKFLGFLPGLASAFILLSFLLTIVISLPFSPVLKRTVSDSKLGSVMVAQTQGFEETMQNIFGGAIHETLNFLTVEPHSEEFVNLNFKVSNGTIDETAEQQMVVLVNKERISQGLKPVKMDTALRNLARNHSQDMLQQGYFSHYTPTNKSPFDRMNEEGIAFGYAGENLALAPNTELAMQGLMQSPGHKANIVSPNFNKIGIGVIDGGIYGEMFSQEFTD